MLIPEYFANQHILITGGTGFVGKVLVEKLLRSCPDIATITLLVRSKRGISPQERWKKITEVALFDKIRSTNPKLLDKVILIESDVSKTDLDLSEADRQFLIDNTTLVYQNAASTQFNNSVIESVLQNTRSTYILLELAKEMKKLEAFVYVSTTYSNFNRPESEWNEEFYPATHDWRVLLKLAETEPQPLALLQGKLVDGHPNTYTFTKHLAENIAKDYDHLFPVIIFRPSVVSATTKEPFPGWTDSMNGLAAVCTGAALGLVRIFYSNWEAQQDFIPVDHVATGLCIVPWKVHKEKAKCGLSVYNCTFGNDIVIPMRVLVDYLSTEHFIPSKFAMLPPRFQPVSNYQLFFILFFFKMVLPCYFLDRLLEFRGMQPRLIKIAKKVAQGTILLRDFATRKISFSNEKYKQLEAHLIGNDKKEFSIKREIKTMDDIHKELQINHLGILKYYLHEEVTEKSMRENGARLKKMAVLETVISILFYAITSWMVFKWFNLSEKISYVIPF